VSLAFGEARKCSKRVTARVVVLSAIVYLANGLTGTLGFVLVVRRRTQNDFALPVAVGNGQCLEHDVVAIS
jgi:hypothetical protein